jgi:hypothetical protein
MLDSITPPGNLNVDDECKLGAPMERDCRGVIPSAFATTLKAHRFVPRSERCVKTDLPDNAPALPTATEKTATKQTGTQKGGENLVRPTVVSKLSTHVLVKDEDKYVVPKHAEVVTGFEKLLIQDKGSFDKANQTTISNGSIYVEQYASPIAVKNF